MCRPVDSGTSTHRVLGQAFHLAATPLSSTEHTLSDSTSLWSSDRTCSPPTGIVAAFTLGSTMVHIANLLFANVLRYNSLSLRQNNNNPGGLVPAHQQ